MTDLASLFDDPFDYQYSPDDPDLQTPHFYIGTTTDLKNPKKSLTYPLGVPGERHAITIASARMGKGQAVIMNNLLYWRGSALTIDPKGEAATYFAHLKDQQGDDFEHDIHVLDPFEVCELPEGFQRASVNLFDELDLNSITIKEDIEAIADGIVMKSNDKGAEYWDENGGLLIAGVIAYVLISDRFSLDQKNLITVRAILRNIDFLDVCMNEMAKISIAGGLCQSAYSAYKAKEGNYFRTNAQSNTTWLDSEAMKNTLGHSTFSLSDLKLGKCHVYLVLPARYVTQHGRFLRLFVRNSIEAMAREYRHRPIHNHGCLFLLDEFFALGYIKEIAVSAGLMPGYGLHLWPILQDLGQLLTLYGQEGSQTFFANADLVQFFGVGDDLTLKFIADSIGQYTAEEIDLPDMPGVPIHTGISLGRGFTALGQLTSQDRRTQGSFNMMGGALAAGEDMVAGIRDQMHQQRMQEYQELARIEMSKVGRYKLPPNVIAEQINEKNDFGTARLGYAFFRGARRTLFVPTPIWVLTKLDSGGLVWGTENYRRLEAERKANSFGSKFRKFLAS